MTNAAASSPPMKNRDLLALRSFITSQDGHEHQHLAKNLVIVDITHSNLRQRHLEIRLDRHASLESLRTKIHQTTGTSAQFQHLQVFDCDTVVADLPPSTPDDTKLGAFLEDARFSRGWRIHCTDLNPLSESAGGGYEDTSLVEKFRLTDEQYDAREGTLRAWSREQKTADPNFSLRQHAAQHGALVEAKRQHKLGLSLPEGFVLDSTGQVIADEPDVQVPAAPTTQPSEAAAQFGPDSVAHVTVGSRCQVEPGQRRGRVAYCGEISQLGIGGWWVGIVLDEPRGKHDGTVPGSNELRLFEAMPNYGTYCRGTHVECGDFPEEDDLFTDSDDDDEL